MVSRKLAEPSVTVCVSGCSGSKDFSRQAYSMFAVNKYSYQLSGPGNL